MGSLRGEGGFLNKMVILCGVVRLSLKVIVMC